MVDEDGKVLLELQGVSKRYDAAGPDAAGVDVLCGVDLVVRAGESIAVTGPSGSGKSTLLNIMAALDRPSSGRVILDGHNLAELSDKAMARVRSERIGMVFQLHHLLPQCTVLENVLVPTIVCPQGRDGAEGRAKELLDRVGLADRMGHRPGQLSGGQRQRVAVVRALINSPQLLLADEPTGSLDEAAAESLADLLVGLNRERGVSLVVATHSMTLAGKMERAATLTHGQLSEDTEAR